MLARARLLVAMLLMAPALAAEAQEKPFQFTPPNLPGQSPNLPYGFASPPSGAFTCMRQAVQGSSRLTALAWGTPADGPAIISSGWRTGPDTGGPAVAINWFWRRDPGGPEPYVSITPSRAFLPVPSGARLTVRLSSGQTDGLFSRDPAFLAALLAADWADLDIVDASGASLRRERIDLADLKPSLVELERLKATAGAALRTGGQGCERVELQE